MNKRTIMGAYVYFCDDNNLERIYATPEQTRHNLDVMLSALLEYRLDQDIAIKERCPHCKGTGKTP